MGLGGKDGIPLATNLCEPTYPDAKRPTTFKEGIEFQDFVCKKLAERHVILQNLASKKYQFEIGENLQGFEIKFDGRCTETFRLSIEVAEKSRADMPDWTPSGIMRKDNTWLYVQGNYIKIFVFAKNWLQRVYKSKSQDDIEDKKTIKTFYLSFQEAEVGAALVIDMGGNHV